MLKLMKYEFARRKRTVLTILLVLVLMEALSIFFLYRKGQWEIGSTMLMFAMFIGVILFVFLESAINYYADFKKSQGTMLFLTPSKGNWIIGSKMLYAAIELLAGMLLVIGFTALTNALAVGAGYTGLQPYMDEFTTIMMSTFGGTSWLGIMIGFLFLVFLQYFASISIAITSVTIGRTLLSRNSYNMLLAIVFYFGVSIVIQFINSMVLLVIGLTDGLWGQVFSGAADITVNMSKYIIAGGIQYALWIVVAYFVSSKLVSRRVDI